MATRIKRYEAPLRELDRLLARIEAEMGPTAEIETRQFSRRRFLGLFGGERMVEVIAVLEVDGRQDQPELAAPAAAADPQPQVDQPSAGQPYVPPLPPAGRPRALDVTADEPVELEPVAGDDAVARITADARQFAQATPAPKPEPELQHDMQSQPAPSEADEQAMELETAPSENVAVESEIGSLRESISELRDTIQLLVRQQKGAAGPEAGTGEVALELEAEDQETDEPAGEETETDDQAEDLPEGGGPLMTGELAAGAAVADPLALDQAAELPPVERRVYDRLLDWNIGAYDALELINTVLEEWQGQELQTEESLLKLITRDICRNILLSGGIKLGSAPPGKAVALIGATGVGKTTTIAKLAAQFTFQAGRRVSLVSLDNYRIAAAEQLRTYAEIMGLDIDIVFGREEFDEVLTRGRQSDLVLIDTAGRSPANARQIYQLREVFSAHPPDEVHLVISASTKADDVRMLLDNFKPLGYDHLIVSKLDETHSLGGLYNLVKHCPLPISYFTVGQSVPEDIRTASLAFVRGWIEQGRIS